MCVRCGGIFNNCFMQISQRICQWKIFENRFRFNEVTAMSLLPFFFWDTVYCISCECCDGCRRSFCWSQFTRLSSSSTLTAITRWCLATGSAFTPSFSLCSLSTSTSSLTESRQSLPSYRQRLRHSLMELRSCSSAYCASSTHLLILIRGICCDVIDWAAFFRSVLRSLCETRHDCFMCCTTANRQLTCIMWQCVVLKSTNIAQIMICSRVRTIQSTVNQGWVNSFTSHRSADPDPCGRQRCDAGPQHCRFGRPLVTFGSGRGPDLVHSGLVLVQNQYQDLFYL